MRNVRKRATRHFHPHVVAANRRDSRGAVAQRLGSGGFRGTVGRAVVDGSAGVAVRDAGAAAGLENVPNRAAETRQAS